MTTTIQIDERTLEMLKKIKDETDASSYDDAINKIIADRLKKESLAGYLGRKPLKDILKGLREKHGRF
jgi:predicted CopG family antitoxin